MIPPTPFIADTTTEFVGVKVTTLHCGATGCRLGVLLPNHESQRTRITGNVTPNLILGGVLPLKYVDVIDEPPLENVLMRLCVDWKVPLGLTDDSTMHHLVWMLPFLLNITMKIVFVEWNFTLGFCRIS